MIRTPARGGQACLRQTGEPTIHLYNLVPEEGLEPSQNYFYTILSRACIPISPLWHVRQLIID